MPQSKNQHITPHQRAHLHNSITTAPDPHTSTATATKPPPARTPHTPPHTTLQHTQPPPPPPLCPPHRRPRRQYYYRPQTHAFLSANHTSPPSLKFSFRTFASRLPEHPPANPHTKSFARARLAARKSHNPKVVGSSHHDHLHQSPPAHLQPQHTSPIHIHISTPRTPHLEWDTAGMVHVSGTLPRMVDAWREPEMYRPFFERSIRWHGSCQRNLAQDGGRMESERNVTILCSSGGSAGMVHVSGTLPKMLGPW